MAEKCLVRSTLPLFSFLGYRLAKNWIAGKDLSDAVNYSKIANGRGYGVILNYLGEEVRLTSEAEEATTEYQKLLALLKNTGIDGAISVKLTQLGLNIGREYCRKNLIQTVSYASQLGRFVWIDMENSRFTDNIISTYSSVFCYRKNVGICLQAQLRRSQEDLTRLLRIGGIIRLVKGAYNEPAALAYQSRPAVRENYSRMLTQLFEESSSPFSVATHDDLLIYEAAQLNRKYHRNFEYAFLKGIREDLKLQLVREGFRVTEYVPYGRNWLQYSIRRLKEKPSNILLLARSLLSN